MPLQDKNANGFDYTTIAAQSDLASSRWAELFHLLEGHQAEFLSHENKFRSEDYAWPRDPLHTWARIWEYPFAYHNIEKWRWNWVETRQPVVVDLGSGVTFFPYTIARLGADVVCADIDPVCGRDIANASQHVAAQPGSVSFRLIDGGKLPFQDGEVDLVYCISVLEHVADIESLLGEVHRVLRSGGHLVFTFDLDIRGDCEIGVADYQKLHDVLDRLFVAAAPKRITHPADVMTSETSPFRPHLPWWRALPFLAKQWLVKPLLGGAPAPLVPFHCTVQGVLMTKP